MKYLYKLLPTKVNQLAAAGRCASPSPRGEPHLVSICVFVKYVFVYLCICVFVYCVFVYCVFVYCVLCVFVPHPVSICEKISRCLTFCFTFRFPLMILLLQICYLWRSYYSSGTNALQVNACFLSKIIKFYSLVTLCC